MAHPTAAGTYTVLASFSGSTDYTAAAASTTFTISNTSTTVSVTDNSGTYTGSAFTATSASIEGVTPTLTYYSGSSATGAALSGAPTTVGTYTVLASFSGSTDYVSGTASTTFTISPASTITSLSASLFSVSYGQSDSLTATVSSSVMVSEGSVTFYDGSTDLGTEPVSGGTATLMTTLPLSGTNNLTASFSDSLGNFASSSTGASAGIINTVAGSNYGDGGPATAANFNRAVDVAVDSAGDVYVLDSNHYSVREINAVTGVITTVAGNGIDNNAGDGGPATAASLNYQPEAIALDSAGDLFIAGGFLLREVNHSTGIINTIAGGGGSSPGTGVAATAAGFGDLSPSGVAVDAAGDVFLTVGNQVFEIKTGTTVLTLVAGNGTNGYSGDGSQGTAAELNGPGGLAVDSSGNLYIYDGNNNRIREVNLASGIITTVVGNGNGNSSGNGGPATAASFSGLGGLALDSAGDIFLTDGNTVREVVRSTGIINAVAGNGNFGHTDGPGTAAEFYQPSGLAIDSSGNIYVADVGSGYIRKINTSDVVSTIGGDGAAYNSVYTADGAPATVAMINDPQGVVVDSVGDVFYSDYYNDIVREVNHLTGVITTVAGDRNGGLSGDGGPATAAELNGPMGLALDSQGDLFIADSGNNRIREVNLSTGVITTYAGITNNYYGSYFGDGGLATAAGLNSPRSIAFDSAGNLYIADEGNNRIREVNNATLDITTVAGNGNGGYSGDGQQATTATLSEPNGVALDSAGNVYIADSSNNAVREVNHLTGIITTIAGMNFGSYSDGIPATTAALNYPTDVAVDAAGDVYISDADYQNRVQEVLASGIITTVTGKFNITGFSGDRGPATNALIDGPAGIALDSSGDLFIADSGNNRIREVGAGGITVNVGQIAPSVSVSDPGGTYNGSAFPATAKVNDSASLEGVTPTLTYYSGMAATGTALGGTPSNAGTYAVLASFAGSTDYTSAAASTTFTISNASTTVSVTDNGGTYTGLAFTATTASIENVTPSLTYYSGTSITGTALSGTPTTAGTYTVLASFSGSTDYASGTASTTFTISKATPSVGVTDTSKAFNGAAFTASETVTGVSQVAGTSLENVTPGLTYYSGTSVTGTALSGAPTTVGTYSVLASFAGSTDYTSAAASTTFTISNAGTTVSVTDNSGTFTGSAFTATTASIENVTPSLTYYSGTSITGTALSGAPTTAGTYTVLASFSGSTDYASGMASTTFTISKATPSVGVTDNSNAYNGTAFTASETVTGVSQVAGTSLENVTPSVIYYPGTSASGNNWTTTVPQMAGTYTVLAIFQGSTDYTSGMASTTFTISKATPSVGVTDTSNAYNGAAFAASETVMGVSQVAGTSLENVTPGLTYYSGTSVTGTALSGAPTTVGSYTVLASFAGSTDYTSAAASTTFTISNAGTTVSVTDNSGTFTGSAFTATTASIENVTPGLTYYSGTSATGTALSGAPTTAGTYTVLASFSGSTDYASGTASTTFTISKAAPSVGVTDASKAYNGAAFTASETVTGVSQVAGTSLENVTPSLSYYSGTSATGTVLGGARPRREPIPCWPVSPAAPITRAQAGAPRSRSATPVLR